MPAPRFVPFPLLSQGPLFLGSDSQALVEKEIRTNPPVFRKVETQTHQHSKGVKTGSSQSGQGFPVPVLARSGAGRARTLLASPSAFRLASRTACRLPSPSPAYRARRELAHLYSNGLYSNGRYSCGLYSYGLYSYGRYS